MIAQPAAKLLIADVEASRLPAGSASFVRQQAPLGLGHAVWCARDVIGNEPFAVLLPDVIVKGKPSSLKQMVDAYDRVGGNIIAVDPVPVERVSSYGVIAPKSRDGRLIAMSGMVEKPPRETAPSNLAITGRYILQPEIFDLLARQAGYEIDYAKVSNEKWNLAAIASFNGQGEPMRRIFSAVATPGWA